MYHHNENYYSYCCTVQCAQHLGASAVLRGEAPGGAGLLGRRGHGRRALVGTRTLASNDRARAPHRLGFQSWRSWSYARAHTHALTPVSIGTHTNAPHPHRREHPSKHTSTRARTHTRTKRERERGRLPHAPDVCVGVVSPSVYGSHNSSAAPPHTSKCECRLGVVCVVEVADQWP